MYPKIKLLLNSLDHEIKIQEVQDFMIIRITNHSNAEFFNHAAYVNDGIFFLTFEILVRLFSEENS